MIEHDELMGTIVFRVKDDVYSTFYKVYIQKYADAKLMSLRCSCPYNLGEICRHETAALLRLQDMVDKNMLMSSAIQYKARLCSRRFSQRPGYDFQVEETFLACSDTVNMSTLRTVLA